MTGQFTDTGGTLTVRTGGAIFATMTVTGHRGAGGHRAPTASRSPMRMRLHCWTIFDLTAQAFGAFDQLLTPVSYFLDPAA